MMRYAEFLRDDAGAVAADRVVLIVGILALGIMIVYSTVSEGVSSLTSNASGTLSAVEVGVDAGSAPDRYGSSGNESSGTNDPCSFPHICNTSGVATSDQKILRPSISPSCTKQVKQRYARLETRDGPRKS